MWEKSYNQYVKDSNFKFKRMCIYVCSEKIQKEYKPKSFYLFLNYGFFSFTYFCFKSFLQ